MFSTNYTEFMDESGDTQTHTRSEWIVARMLYTGPYFGSQQSYIPLQLFTSEIQSNVLLTLWVHFMDLCANSTLITVKHV